MVTIGTKLVKIGIKTTVELFMFLEIIFTSKRLCIWTK